MKRFFYLLPILAAMLVVSPLVWAQTDAVKIGLVDLQRILNVSEAGRKATAELQSRGDALEKELAKRGEELEEMMKNFDRRAQVMTPEGREEQRRQITIARMDYQSLQKRYSDEFSRLEATMRNEIFEEVLTIVERIGKDEGYTLVMDRSVAGVVFAPEGLDLTERVIREFNQVWKAKQAQPKP
ncbi:MAG: OmpH family outer membrane protein [Desulfatibacillaceae bacterium]|nr:OmpH family outer membrane protein [Desulfatibacillaceae bacterium]